MSYLLFPPHLPFLSIIILTGHANAFTNGDGLKIPNALDGLFTDSISNDDAILSRQTRSYDGASEVLQRIRRQAEEKEPTKDAAIKQFGDDCEDTDTPCSSFSGMEEYLCILHCMTKKSPLVSKYANIVPQVAEFMCMTNPPKLFQWIQKIKDGIQANAKTFVQRKPAKQEDLREIFKYQHDEIPEFAKFAASALTTMLTMLGYEDVSKIGIIAEKLSNPTSGVDLTPLVGDTSSLQAEFGEGKFVGQDCQSAMVKGLALRILEPLQETNCLLDALMPGYFFLTKFDPMDAPKRFRPVLRAFNIPLFLMSGVQCCLIPYRWEGSIMQCDRKYANLLQDPDEGNLHKLPPPASTVCSSIPDYKPEVKPPKGTETTEDPAAGCDPDEDALYTNEDDEPCTAAPPAAPAEAVPEAGGSDYSGEAKPEAVAEGMEGRSEIDVLISDSDVDAAYGENAPRDDEFIA